jgi:hypothetical protein
MEEKIALETDFPSSKDGYHIVEDEVISDFPDIPSGTCKNLKEARSRKVCSSGTEVVAKICIKVPVNIQEIPTALSKFTLKEEML